MAKIVVFANGKAQQIEASFYLMDLMGYLKLNPKTVLVEHNGRALLKTEWEGRRLEHGDRIEFLRIVAGG